MRYDPSQRTLYLRAETPADFAEQLRWRKGQGWQVLVLWAIPEAHEYAAILLLDGGALEEAKDG